jgi:heme A synthase
MNWEPTTSPVIAYPLWVRAASALTAVSVFILLAIGTLVTTFGVGMADTVWPTPPWYLLFHERAGNFGWYVEHAHRIAGYAVGFLILLIAVTLWSYSPSRWHRRLGWLAIALVSLGTGLGMYQVRHAPSKSAAALLNGGFALASAGMLLGIAVTLIEGRSRFAGRWHRILALAAFLAVIVQGLLGGLRVYLNELSGPELAIIHGVFAQFVAAAVCSLALLSSVRWNRFTELRTDSWIRLASLVLLLLLLIQIVFGGMLRHLDATWGKRLHPMLAILVLVIGAGLVWRATQTGLEHPILSRKARSLFGMMVIQALLGVEAFVRVTDATAAHRGATYWDAAWQSLHVWIGYGVFATSVMFAMRAWKGRLL